MTTALGIRQVVTSSTRPVNPVEGTMIYETDTDYVYVWDGQRWIDPRYEPESRALLAYRSFGNDFITASEQQLTDADDALWVAIPAGRQVKVTYNAEISVGANTGHLVKLKRDGTQISWATPRNDTASIQDQSHRITRVETPGAGLFEYTITHQKTVGANSTEILSNSNLLVEAIA